MVNHFTNINKTNNKQWWSTIPLISAKQTINSDGQQLHQYQQNEQQTVMVNNFTNINKTNNNVYIGGIVVHHCLLFVLLILVELLTITVYCLFC
jgi:hypothetical protein